jgi:adenylate kinase family enzyme
MGRLPDRSKATSIGDGRIAGNVALCSPANYEARQEEPMGVRNYLIEGLSGAGKTTVAEELGRRGHHVVHGDRKFAYYGDPETGAPLQRPAGMSDEEALEWAYWRWIWPLDKVRALIADRTHAMTFFCGGSRNRHHFIELFDKVFVLEADPATLNSRMATRPEDVFGGRQMDRELTLRLHASREDVPANAISIDSTRPIGQVVDEILGYCRD